MEVDTDGAEVDTDGEEDAPTVAHPANEVQGPGHHDGGERTCQSVLCYHEHDFSFSLRRDQEWSTVGRNSTGIERSEVSSWSGWYQTKLSLERTRPTLTWGFGADPVINPSPLVDVVHSTEIQMEMMRGNQFLPATPRDLERAAPAVETVRSGGQSITRRLLSENAQFLAPYRSAFSSRVPWFKLVNMTDGSVIDSAFQGYIGLNSGDVSPYLSPGNLIVNVVDEWMEMPPAVYAVKGVPTSVTFTHNPCSELIKNLRGRLSPESLEGRHLELFCSSRMTGWKTYPGTGSGPIDPGWWAGEHES